MCVCKGERGYENANPLRTTRALEILEKKIPDHEEVVRQRVPNLEGLL